jgi:hypothetical protein
MKSATLSELKKELIHLPASEVIDICLRLGRFKAENKELLTYILFESADENRFIRSAITEIDECFKDINKQNLYLAKKTIRKILKIVRKNIRYSGKKETETELLLHFCEKLLSAGIPLQTNKVILNMYNKQVETIRKTISTLHEDLQFDYQERVERLRFPG